MDGVAVRVLRAACSSARETARTGVAVAPTVNATADTARRVIQLVFGGHTVSLIGVDEDRLFRAEVDGARRTMRWRQSRSYSATPTARPPWKEGTAAEIGPLLKCVDNDAKRTEDARGLTLKLEEAGAHFRQNEWTDVVVTVAPDGAVEVDTEIVIQDDSYY
jgi:hypothetical protein